MLRRSLLVCMLVGALLMMTVGGAAAEFPGDDPVEEACHPTAQWIADALALLDPGLVQEGPYTCEDIFAIFEGGLTELQLGFGRMRHALNLTQEMGEIAWETVLNWHLDGNGWGSLGQLNTFSEILEDWSLEDLMALLDGETSVTQIRHAVRMVDRYGADFEEALAMATDPEASSGQVNQFFHLSEQLGLESELLSTYLDEGHKPSDIRQAARMADGDLDELGEILSTGIQEYRRAEHEADKEERKENNGKGQGNESEDPVASGSQSSGQDKALDQLAKQLGLDVETVMVVWETICNGDRSCVRDHFRHQESGGDGKGKGKNHRPNK